MGLLDLEQIYTWQDIKKNGSKNPRARKKKKVTDKEYLAQIDFRDNYKYLYAQGEKIHDRYKHKVADDL